ncbi:MAG TPA: hypothetical protein DCY00_02020 [Actinobacteria bacterium]|nr:hypothetical protein [Actinomycetota bacterium]
MVERMFYGLSVRKITTRGVIGKTGKLVNINSTKIILLNQLPKNYKKKKKKKGYNSKYQKIYYIICESLQKINGLNV